MQRNLNSQVFYSTSTRLGLCSNCSVLVFPKVHTLVVGNCCANRTSESDTKLSYLDISISIRSSKYVTEVYDKRMLLILT